MATVDPERERQRLADSYAGQMDDELKAIATKAYQLTDRARTALKQELARRRLTVELGEDPGWDEFELREMVTVRQFRDLPEALLARDSLVSAGIEAELADDNMVRMDWFISNALGGVKLKVKAEDVALAQEILDQPIPENFEVDGVGDYQQPHCPKCQSLDVNFQESSPAAYVTAFLKVPLPLHRHAWHCRSCGAEWEDDGEPQIPAEP